LLGIFKDADKMPGLWKEWLQGAEKIEQRLKDEGHLTERVYIDPDTFPNWCAKEGISVDTHGRQKFVAIVIGNYPVDKAPMAR
jgi:hypothetical protein